MDSGPTMQGPIPDDWQDAFAAIDLSVENPPADPPTKTYLQTPRMTNDPGTSYDEVPYESLPLAQTHPARTNAIARLLGLRPPPPSRSRILEIGCAGGGNLLPMALAMPDAQLVGIDLSRLQIEQGREIADRLSLANLSLRQMDLMDAGAELGEFDYIIVHGVFSWVPRPVQDRLFQVCRQLLSPEGVVYISYNALPGWHFRRVVRDLVRYHALQFPDPETRVAQARAILDFVARESVVPNQILQDEVALLLERPDSYVLHEHLESDNEALYFHEFLERARPHGLQYLGEAEFGSMLIEGFSRQVRETLPLITDDLVRQQQLMDFLRNRTFRQTLLVRDDLTVSRSLNAGVIEDLWITGAVREVTAADAAKAPPGAKSFAWTSGVQVTTTNVLTQQALGVVERSFPTAIRFDQLIDEAARMVRPYSQWRPSSEDRTVLKLDLLHCFAAGAVELLAEAPALVNVPGLRPVASAIARLQARAGQPVSTLRHESIRLAPELSQLLTLLDGTRDREALMQGSPFVSSLQQLEEALRLFGYNALLTA